MEINYIRFEYFLDLLKMMISFSGKSTRNKATGFHGMHKKRLLEVPQANPNSPNPWVFFGHDPQKRRNVHTLEGKGIPGIPWWIKQELHQRWGSYWEFPKRHHMMSPKITYTWFFAQIDLKVILEFHQSFFFLTGLQWIIMKGAMTMFVTDWSHLHHPRIGRWKPIDLKPLVIQCVMENHHVF